MSRAISGVRLIRTTAASPALSTQHSVPEGPGLAGGAADDDAVFQEGYDGGHKRKTSSPAETTLRLLLSTHIHTVSGSLPTLARGHFQAFPLMGTWTKKRAGERGGETQRWVCHNLHSSCSASGRENSLEVRCSVN